MIKFNCKNVDSNVIGSEHGLNLKEEFNTYKDRISNIISDLNQRKDKPNEWLQWMNLAYNQETLWYVKEYASDEEWFRYLIIMIIFFLGMIAILVCSIIFTMKNKKDYYDPFKKLDIELKYYKAYVILAIIAFVFQILVCLLDLVVHFLMFKNYVCASYVEHTATSDDEDIVIIHND